MQAPPEKTKRKKPLILTERDEKILRTIYEYRYMTTFDVSHLLFKPTSKNHVGEILTALAGGKDLQTHSYLCRFGLPSVGNAERIFTLGAKGRQFVLSCGLPRPTYFYPYKANHLSSMHLKHSLLTARFVVAANVWAKKQTKFNLVSVRFGHQFRRLRVVPDAWLLFERVSNKNKLPIFIEIDRGMEYQKRFKEHIRSRIQFYQDGTYTKMFGSQSVTIAYATTGEIPAYKERRCQTMALWTREVLQEMNIVKEWGHVFRFASVEFGSLYGLTLFEKPVWYRVDSVTPVPLLTP